MNATGVPRAAKVDARTRASESPWRVPWVKVEEIAVWRGEMEALGCPVSGRRHWGQTYVSQF